MEGIESKRVLIVEDDMLLSLVEERLIQKLGHQVVAKVDNAREAIEKAAELSPDLIVMDIVLKGDTDGIEAMEEIRKHSDIPVIYLSGNSDRYNFERAKKTGFTDYLIKPITINDLKKPFNEAFKEEMYGEETLEHSSRSRARSSRLNQTA